jgi:uncharacterized protein YjiK
MKTKFVILFAVTALSQMGMGAGVLSSYTSVSAYVINEQEASAVSYNPNTGTLVTVGDEGRFLTEYSKTGVFIGRSAIGGISDAEGLAYLGRDGDGRDRFMVADERIQKASNLIQTRNLTTDPGSYPDGTNTLSFGDNVGNVGLEGVAYDPLTNSLWGVKEKQSQAIYQMSMAAGGGLAVNPITADTWGLADLSDIYVLASCAVFVGTDREWNLLVLSQESKMLIEVTRTGEIVGSLDLATLGLPKDDTIEGVTMDENGTLYLVAEGGSKSLPSHMYALTSVPEPSVAILGAIGSLGLFRRRRSCEFGPAQRRSTGCKKSEIYVRFDRGGCAKRSII